MVTKCHKGKKRERERVSWIKNVPKLTISSNIKNIFKIFIKWCYFLPVSQGEDSDILQNFMAQPSDVQVVTDVLDKLKYQVSLIQTLQQRFQGALLKYVNKWLLKAHWYFSFHNYNLPKLSYLKFNPDPATKVLWRALKWDNMWLYKFYSTILF